MITSLDQLDLTKEYTYADYLTWRLTERVELIRGKILRMSPGPNRRHQEVSGELYGLMWSYFRSQNRSGCQLFSAPFDVRLPLPQHRQKKGKINTVVQPDILVVCDPDKLDDQGCNGAPDLVVEILSPGNSKREMKVKMELYQNTGVQEYWIVDPYQERIFCYHLDAVGEYQGGKPYFAEDDIPSRVLEGFVLKGSEVLNYLEDTPL